uniref:AlNc14C334G10715 protein n=1 Tax=Albugo laibachii Nc14 TaxID=890382 RepID=F0WWV4_9STRA|nr:AlNc14C334G10715 [Albugo laibachii Nc14]|eukprot:CCA25939.1 AlNc14C334G10715 [Albugo laibachii Nc14]
MVEAHYKCNPDPLDVYDLTPEGSGSARGTFQYYSKGNRLKLMTNPIPPYPYEFKAINQDLFRWSTKFSTTNFRQLQHRRNLQNVNIRGKHKHDDANNQEKNILNIAKNSGTESLPFGTFVFNFDILRDWYLA